MVENDETKEQPIETGTAEEPELTAKNDSQEN